MIALAQPLTICKSQPIPSGYVIVGQVSNVSCPGPQPAAWTIQTPSSGMTICKDSPFPSGYVMVAQVSSVSCPGPQPTAMTIQTPSSGLIICKDSPFPSGYVMVSEVGSVNCPGPQPTAMTIQTPSSGMTICKDSPFPSGYVMVSQVGSVNCPGPQPTAMVIKTPFSGMTICKDSPFPSGYVMVSEVSTVNCPGPQPTAMTIQTPSSGMTICKISPIPSGYVIVSEIQKTMCPGPQPTAMVIKTPSSGMTICKISPIPSGYVIVSEVSSGSCSGPQPAAWKIQSITAPIPTPTTTPTPTRTASPPPPPTNTPPPPPTNTPPPPPTKTPPPSPTNTPTQPAVIYQGYADGADCSSIWGWAWNQNAPNTPISVDIYADGTLLARVPASTFRQDLLNAGIGNGYHGFTYAVPTSLRNRQTHSIQVTIAGTSLELIGSLRSIACGVSLFRTQTPDSEASGQGQTWEQAAHFFSSVSGEITHIRFWKHCSETGTHVGWLWTESGTRLGSATFTNETPCGWQEAELKPHIPIRLGVRYRVSYNINVYVAKTWNVFTSPVTNGPLTAYGSSYSTPGGSFPTTGSTSNLFADVLFNSPR